jgi:response regulator RpfG family c-di-GMP phosphodiesterase
MPKETILVIQSDPKIRVMCRECLSSKQYQVIAVGDCESAIRAALDGPIDLYLIDLQLPDMSGLDLLERIKAFQPEAQTLVSSGNLTNEQLLRALQLGVKGFMVKPFGTKELLDSTKKILEDHRLLRARIQSHVLNPLFEISESFLSEIDLQQVLRQIVGIAKQETRADLITLMLVDSRSARLNTSISSGVIPGDLEAEIKRLQQQFGEWVMIHKEPLIMMEGVNTPGWIEEPCLYRQGFPACRLPAGQAGMGRFDTSGENHIPIRSLSPPLQAGNALAMGVQKTIASRQLAASICLPLLRKDRIIGVLLMSKKEGIPSFNQNDLALATVLCRQAAILIDNVQLFDEVKRKAQDLEEAQLDAIKALAEALESKDAYTRDHSDRALQHAVAVAERMGLSAVQKERLKYAAVLHDIGKIGVPENILKKTTKLTQEEYEVMKTHPEKGAEIIKHIKSLSEVVPLVLYHQERYDGKGYPKGLAGDAIPIESRIVAVLDAFDAMTSDRVYRKAPGRQRAIEELKRYAGTQFDPGVVQAFLEVIGEVNPISSPQS